MRKGSACAAPPTNVATPVIIPRVTELPRPVSEPSSDSPSERPIEMAAPSAAATPTSSAAREPDTYAAAKIGARRGDGAVDQADESRLDHPQLELARVEAVPGGAGGGHGMHASSLAYL